jgi:hypothetical protein
MLNTSKRKALAILCGTHGRALLQDALTSASVITKAHA